MATAGGYCRLSGSQSAGSGHGDNARGIRAGAIAAFNKGFLQQ